MRRFPVLAAVAALALALAPAAADARAGAAGSFGSRGSRTYVAPPSTSTAPSAAPMERSMTAPSGPGMSQPGYAQPGFGAPAYAGRSSFMSGLMGGFLGAGLAGLLFGHGFGGFGSFIWFLIEIGLLVLLVRFLFRRFGGRIGGPQPLFAGLGNIGRGMMSGVSRPQARMAAAPLPGGSAPRLAIGPGDYQAFDGALVGIQRAWTAHDLPALREMVSPEMLTYFSEQLAEQESRGVRNSVTDVRLVKGDLSEAWSERGRDYATVAMRFSMVDVTRDRAGHVVDGSPTEHVTATEFWTFLRATGGRWILSAIQQAK